MLANISFNGLHQILADLYNEMLPLCENMIGFSKALAGFAALFYIGSKIWQAIAKAEPVEVYPLLRPFIIGLCIMFFQVGVINTMNTVLSPLTSGCAEMKNNQVRETERILQERNQKQDDAMLRNPAKAFLVSDEAYDRKLENIGFPAGKFFTMIKMEAQRIKYNAFQTVREWFRQILDLIYHACVLGVDTMRTFYLIVLTILGPLAFAFSVFDGFQSTLTQWISRYISTYLWLPIADIFSTIMGKIQAEIFRNEIIRFDNPEYIADGTNSVYLIFTLIGIIGFFHIPSMAEWVIQAGGVGNMGKSINNAAKNAGTFAAGAAGAATGNAIGGVSRGIKRLYNKYKK